MHGTIHAIHANLPLVRVSDPMHCGPRAVVLAFASWFYSLAVKEVEAWGQRSSFCSSALWWNPDLLFHSGILERFPTEPVLLLPYSHAFDGCVFVSVWTCVCFWRKYSNAGARGAQYDENLYRSMNITYHSNSVFHEIVIFAGNSVGKKWFFFLGFFFFNSVGK